MKKNQVKIFTKSGSGDELEKQVNEWLETQWDSLEITHIALGVNASVYLLTIFYSIPTNKE